MNYKSFPIPIRFANKEDALEALHSGNYSKQLKPFTKKWKHARYEMAWIKAPEQENSSPD